jgi:hypothetical protein
MDNKPVSDDNSGKTPNQPTNWFEEVFFFIIAGLTFAIWEPTKLLLRRTYTSRDGNSSEPNLLNIALGVLISLGSGIGVGYQLGWVGHANFWHWVPWGLGTAAAIFVYGWTIVYLLTLKYAFKLSNKLWAHVNIDAKEYRSWSGDAAKTGTNPAWFSKFLMFVGFVGAGLASLGTLIEVASYIQAHQSGWGWLGWIMGVICVITAIGAAISVLVGAGKIGGGKFSFFVFLVGCGLTWWFHGTIGSLFTGLFHNLRGADWGNWGYVPGGFIGLIAAGIVGGGLVTLLNNLRMRLVAAVFGGAATYALLPHTNALISQIPLGGFGFVAPVLPWLAYGLELLLFIGFAFPIIHIFVTHGLRKLANVAELMEDVYGEERGGYREFFLQVVTIVATGLVIWKGASLLALVVTVPHAWIAYAATGLAALLTYTLGYKALDKTGSAPIGLACAGYFGLIGFEHYYAHQLWFGLPGAIGAGIISAVATFAIGFPAAYLGVRFLTGSWLGLLRDPLVRLHARICSGLGELVDKLFDAADATYGDKTPFREVFLHITNILVALAVAGAVYLSGQHVGVALWLTAVLAALLSFTSYVLVGKGLLRFGAAPIGFIVAAVAGYFAGTFIHGAQPADWGGYRYILSTIGWLLSSAIVFGGPFCWLYLVFQLMSDVVSADKWLRPLLMGGYDRVWTRFRVFGANFMAKYRLFKTRFADARARFAASYARFQERWNERTKKSK